MSKASKPKRRPSKKTIQSKEAPTGRKTTPRKKSAAEVAKAQPTTTATAPQATVHTRKLGETRLGRGFSVQELRAAGITLLEARKRGLKLDFKRLTAHEENIAALRAWLGAG